MKKILLSMAIGAGLFFIPAAHADQFEKGSEFKNGNIQTLVITGIRSTDESLSRYTIGWGLVDMGRGIKNNKKAIGLLRGEKYKNSPDMMERAFHVNIVNTGTYFFNVRGALYGVRKGKKWKEYPRPKTVPYSFKAEAGKAYYICDYDIVAVDNGKKNPPHDYELTGCDIEAAKAFLKENYNVEMELELLKPERTPLP